MNRLTGKCYPGTSYAPKTINRNLSVLAAFYDFALAFGVGPLLNPVPSQGGGRLFAHHNPMRPFESSRRASYRQRVPRRVPRGLADGLFNDLFAAMRSDRDRALLAFYVSSGTRASELLGLVGAGVDVGRQSIAVVRKGSRELQWLPASSDAFVWLRLYQAGHGVAVADGPVWVTRRRPVRPLTYPALRAVLQRANGLLGTNWTLHDLRHTAAHRMVDDPKLSLTDVQWVLGHAHVTTTQLYVEPRQQEVISRVLRHYDDLGRSMPPAGTPPSGGYRPIVLETLLGPSGVG